MTLFGGARTYEFGPFRLDPAERLLLRGGRPVALTPKAFDLLAYLVERPGRLVDKQALMAVLWPDAVVEEANLAYNVSAVRKALGDGQEGEQFIQTVPTRGYRFVAPVREVSAKPTTAPAGRRIRPGALAAMAFATGGLLVGIVLWPMRRFDRAPRPVVRFELPLAVALTELTTPAVSPDGTRIAYVARSGEEGQLHVRPLASLAATPLAGTGGARQPFFSPDGRAVAFYTAGFLMKVDLSTGHVTRLCPGTVLHGRGGTWGEDGRIYFARSSRSGLSVVSADGGQTQALTELGSDIAHGWPELLPDGRHVLFSRWERGALDEAKIEVLTLSTGERRTIVEGGFGARYLTTGHLVYVRQASLLAVSFDLRALQVRGTPVRVLESVGVWPNGAALWSVSRDGTLVYCPGSLLRRQSELVWVEGAGRQERPIAAPPAFHIDPRLSPDGRRLVVGSSGGVQTEVWAHAFDRGTWTRLTTDPGYGAAPVWHPGDPNRVVFTSGQPPGQGDLYSIPADGSDRAALLHHSPHFKFATSSAPAARLLSFVELRPDTKSDIWLLHLDGKPAARLFLQTPFDEESPALSPDGQWLAYDSDESGRPEVYVRPVVAADRKWQLSIDGGDRPRWSGDGRRIVFRSGRRMMAVDVTTVASFAPGSPRVLFEGEFEPGGTSTANYDVTADGRRLLMIKPAATSSTPSRLVVVENWFAELQEKLGP
jgi:DNA-binding winged helix-turn-helix (wHTH) protein/Tol biopolymer transport system component